MSRREEDPVRWTDAPSEDALERRAGELLKVPPPPPLGPVRRARIEMRLTAGAGASPRLRLGYVMAAVVAALAVAGGVVAAVGSRRDRNADDDASLDDGDRSAPHGRTVTGDSVPPEEPAPAVPPTATAPPSGAAPRVHRPKTNVGGAAVQHDPDEPPAPAGRRRSAVGATPAGRRARAGCRPGGTPRGRWRWWPSTGGGSRGARSRSRRGSPRWKRWSRSTAAAKRWPCSSFCRSTNCREQPSSACCAPSCAPKRDDRGDAIADFTPCADGARCRPDTEERALYGRASCRERVGQRAGARADLERYLARFPRGRFASAVRTALDSH